VCILDVAGGKGELSRQLLSNGIASEVVLVDPRCNVREFEGLVHCKEYFSVSWEPDRKIDLLVGMHIDEA
jgi:hypothetical protein